MMATIISIGEFMQRLLFDIGDIVAPPPPSPKKPRVVIRRKRPLAFPDEYRPLFSISHPVQATNKPKKQRKTSKRDSIWSLPADYVDRHMPEKHREIQRLIYEIRAPEVRSKWRKKHERKANHYPARDIVVQPLDTRDTGIDLNTREIIE